MIEVDATDFENLKPILTGIGVISKEAMIEQSSKAGDKARKAVRGAFLSSTTEWTQDYENGRRIIRQQKGYAHILGWRISHKDKGGFADPKNMANFITSFTHKTTGTTVVAGTHPAFRPDIIRDGKVVGTLPRVKGISKQTLAILEKLDRGDRLGRFSSQGFLRWRTKEGGESSKSIPNFEGTWKARHFIRKGWSAVQGQVLSDMTSELQRLVGERANKTDLTKVKYAV